MEQAVARLGFRRARPSTVLRDRMTWGTSPGQPCEQQQHVRLVRFEYAYRAP